MELAMTNGFSELSFNEMEMVDGGGWPWYYHILAGLGPVGLPVIAEIEAAKYVYKLGYDNGYNSTRY